MESNSLVVKFYYFAEKVMRIAQFQLLWILFALCGGIILGVMPATVGLFTVMRKWLLGNEDNQSYVKMYWSAFRNEFWNANLIGLILTIIGFMIYMNASLLRFTHGAVYWFLVIFDFMIAILFAILSLYIIPVYVHFENKFSRYFSVSILLGISFPFHTLLIAIGYYLIFMLLRFVPGLIPFLSIGLFAMISMWVSLKVFTMMEAKQEKQEKALDKRCSVNEFLAKGGEKVFEDANTVR